MKKKLIVLVAAIVVILVAGWRSFGAWGKAVYDTNIGSNSYGSTGEILSGTVIKQEFLCGQDGLSGVSIKISKLGYDIDSELYYLLKEQGKSEILAEGFIDAAAFADNSFNKIKFPEIIENSKNKEYVIEIQGNATAEGNGIAIYMTEPGDDAGQLVINGEESEQALVLRVITTRFNLENFIVFIGLASYLFLFAKVLNRFLK